MYRKTRQLLFLRAGLLAGSLLLAGPVWASGQVGGPEKPGQSSEQPPLAPGAGAGNAGIVPMHVVTPEEQRAGEESIERLKQFQRDFDALPQCSQKEIEVYLQREKDYPDRYHDPDGTGYSLAKRADLATNRTALPDDQHNMRCKMGPFPEFALPPQYDFAYNPIHWKDLPDHIGELFELKKLDGLVQCPDYVEELGDQYFMENNAMSAPDTGYFGQAYAWNLYDLGGDEYCVKMRIPEPHYLTPDEARILLSVDLRDVPEFRTLKDYFVANFYPAPEKVKKKDPQIR